MKLHIGKTGWYLLVILIAIGVGLGIACSAEDTPIPPTDRSVPPPDVATSTPSDSDNQNPRAHFSWNPSEVPYNDNYQTEITFSADAFDPDGDRLIYSWSFAGGDPARAESRTPKFRVAFNGYMEHLVTLTVTDGRGGEAVVHRVVPREFLIPTPAYPIPPPHPQADGAAKYTWDFVEVGSGARPSLALRSDDIPAIAYLEMREEVTARVRYGEWHPPDEWNPEYFGSETVTEDYFSAPVDLAIGPGDAPFIAWHGRLSPGVPDPMQGSPVFAFKEGFYWTVGTTGHDGWAASIAVDPQGGIHIVAASRYGEGLEYYFCDEEVRGCTEEWIDTPPVSPEWGVGLALDSQSRPHIVFHAPESADLLYTFRGDEGWKVYVVDSEGDVGKFPSLALDRNDLPVIAYMHIIDGPRSGHTHAHIKLARAVTMTESGPEWEFEYLGSVGGLFLGLQGARQITSVVVDSANMPIVAYSDLNTIYLTYIYAPDHPVWWKEVVLHRKDTVRKILFGQQVSLAIDSEDRLHLAFTEVLETYRDGLIGTVMYARGKRRVLTRNSPSRISPAVC